MITTAISWLSQSQFVNLSVDVIQQVFYSLSFCGLFFGQTGRKAFFLVLLNKANGDFNVFGKAHIFSNAVLHSFRHAVARLSSNTFDLPDGGSVSFAAGASGRTLIGS